MIDAGLRETLAAIVGDRYVQSGDVGEPGLVLRPGSTEEVSRCLRVLSNAAQPVVTLGGLTGLVGGTDVERDVVGISTDRLTEIHSIDPARRQLLVGAGVKLEQVHEYANRHGLRYGVDFGARGSCSIGGAIATNAGGNGVARFGMTRANIAGLEVVLSDGTTLSDLGGLTKNNTGYDLKQLFIGSEGTLGIVTKALLALRQASAETASVLLAVETFDDALAILEHLQQQCGNSLLALEVMWNRYYRSVGVHILGSARLPVSPDRPIYILAQVETTPEGPSAQDQLLQALEGAPSITDSALASTVAQEKLLWAIRDGSEVIERAHPVVASFDVSMHPENYASYIADVESRLHAALPHAVPYYFGHLADGNLHFMIGHDGGDPNARATIEACVYEPLSRHLPSSISAEHGIGREKIRHLWRSRSAAEIRTMNAIRRALDPAAILNPHIQYVSSGSEAGITEGARPWTQN